MGVINGLPYPEGTEKVADGDNAIKALATAVDRNPTNASGLAVLVNITYGAGWAALGSGLRVQQINGWIWLNGRATRASGSSTTIGTLPAGYFPLPSFWIPANGGAVIAIAANGAISLDSGVASGAFNLFVTACWPARVG